MSKFILNVKLKKTLNAMSKAKEDTAKILTENLGFEEICISKMENKFDKFIHTNKIINQINKKLNSGDVFAFQYPSYEGRRFETKLINALCKKDVFKVAIMHDIDILRFPNAKTFSLTDMCEFLNNFEVVISSNFKMTKLLRENGLDTKVVDLQIFDYLTDQSVSEKKLEKKVNFAGNLDKSEFINSYPKNIKTVLNLFGIISDKKNLPINSEYQGSFTPEELTEQFTEGFGLVWDGTSSQRIEGSFGKYLAYNNPHKASLYIVSGLPIVIWKGAAIAKFVEENGLGILVDSLESLDDAIENVSADQYQEYVKNCLHFREKLISGFYVTKAMKDAIEVENN